MTDGTDDVTHVYLEYGARARNLNLDLDLFLRMDPNVAVVCGDTYYS